MADIFDEINAELRQDRLNAVWEKYGIYVISIALAIVLFVAGSAGWQSYSKGQNESASAAYETLLSDLEYASTTEQMEALAAFSSNADNAYTVLADLRRAKLLAEGGDDQEAVGLYDALAADRGLPSGIKDYARLAAVSLLVDTAAPAALEERLETALEAESPFRHAAREMLALSYFKAGDYLMSKELLTTALSDPKLPAQMQLRLLILNKNVDDFLNQGDR
ncbi:MAG: tetratricopeptide repeat protein [Parvibaculales bacterium]